MTPSNFPWFDIIKGVSNNIHGMYYKTEDSYDAVDIKASNTEAPEDGWWCPNFVLVVAGTKLSMGGVLFASPQDDPQSVKVGGLYISDGRFCPVIDFWYVFTFLIIKDTLAEKGLVIDFELRKVNVRASSMRIGVSSTKQIETLCKEDEYITAFEASFTIHIEDGNIKTRVWMKFDNTKYTEKLMRK